MSTSLVSDPFLFFLFPLAWCINLTTQLSFAEIEEEQKRREAEEAIRRENERMLVETVHRAQQKERGGASSGAAGTPWKATPTWSAPAPKAPSLREIETELSKQQRQEQASGAGSSQPPTAAQQLKTKTRVPAGGWGAASATGPMQSWGVLAPAAGRGRRVAGSTPSAPVGGGGAAAPVAPVAAAAPSAAAAVGKRANRPKSLVEIAREEELAAARQREERSQAEAAMPSRPTGVWTAGKAWSGAAATGPTPASAASESRARANMKPVPKKTGRASATAAAQPPTATSAPAAAAAGGDDDGSFWTSAKPKAAKGR